MSAEQSKDRIKFLMKESNYDARFNLDEGRAKLVIDTDYKKDPTKIKVKVKNDDLRCFFVYI